MQLPEVSAVEYVRILAGLRVREDAARDANLPAEATAYRDLRAKLRTAEPAAHTPPKPTTRCP